MDIDDPPAGEAVILEDDAWTRPPKRYGTDGTSESERLEGGSS